MRHPFSQSPGIHVTTYYCNATFGSTDSVQTPGARKTRTRYDGMGRDTASNAGSQKWVRQQRDVLNRITKAIGDAGAGVTTPDTTLYTYTENLRRTAVRDPIGNNWTYDANALGVLTQVTDPAGILDKYFVDALGRVTVWRTRRDDSTYTVYDNLSRVLRRTVRTRTGGTLNTIRA